MFEENKRMRLGNMTIDIEVAGNLGDRDLGGKIVYGKHALPFRPCLHSL